MFPFKIPNKIPKMYPYYTKQSQKKKIEPSELFTTNTCIPLNTEVLIKKVQITILQFSIFVFMYNLCMRIVSLATC